MRPQRKRMTAETKHAFVKLKLVKAAVSAGGTKLELLVCSEVQTFDLYVCVKVTIFC